MDRPRSKETGTTVNMRASMMTAMEFWLSQISQIAAVKAQVTYCLHISPPPLEPQDASFRVVIKSLPVSNPAIMDILPIGLHQR